MVEVADSSIHLVVTSPPYWQLKDYGHEGQIGYHDDLSTYVNDLNLVWRECHRALHPGCRLCVNIGDQFARAIVYGRYKLISIQSEIIRFCETVGFDYMGTIIWQKATTVNTTGGAVVMGSFPYPRNGIVKVDYEHILLFKKAGDAPRPSAAAKEAARLTTEEWNRYFFGHWTFPGERQTRHLAAFPEELPRRLIRMFSFPGETILDPFCGSGTTQLAAKNLDRSSIGYEINPEFEPLILDRLGAGDEELFADRSVSVAHQRPLTPAERSHDDLPYRYRDPHSLERLVDPKSLRLGSRIDGAETGAARHHRVEDVVDYDRATLDSGLVVRLAGVSVPAHAREPVHRFLSDWLRGRTVEVRFVGRPRAVDGSLLAALTVDGVALKDHLRRQGFPISPGRGSQDAESA